MVENKNIDKKSLRFLNGKGTNWNELAKDCVCFANALRAETKKLEALYQKKIEDLEELKKSILQKAFAGEMS